MTKCTGVALTPEDIERFGENPAASFAANLERVKQRIAAAAHRGGRDARDIRLLPVTKTIPARVLRLACRRALGDGPGRGAAALLSRPVWISLPRPAPRRP